MIQLWNNDLSMKVQVKRLLISAVFVIGLIGSVDADLTKRINGIISQASQKNVRFSIKIIKADSAATVYRHNANRTMVPASNMKIIISAAALKYLGPNYEYKTKVGLCDDTVVIIGSGDPLLGDKDTNSKYNKTDNWIFENIATALKQNDQTTISDIIVDSSIFDDERVHPNWPKEQLNRSYACEVGGLNFNGNCIEISAENVSGKAVLSIEPPTDYVKITNKVVPITKGKSAIGSYRQPEPNKIVVFGKCKKKDGPFAVAIERPATFFGFLLAENLAREGINAQGQLIEKKLDKNCNFKKLTEFVTSMADCLTRCNKDSFGLAAESLLKTIAAYKKENKKNAGWEGGREVIGKYMRKLGIDNSEFYIDDGSGLSRENKLSANAITAVLLDIYKSKDWQLYKDSLAVGGIDGTMGKYFKEKKYKGKIFGKTGYIGGVKALSGLCSAADGDYIFSILTNKANGQTRKAINDIAKAIIDEQS